MSKIAPAKIQWLLFTGFVLIAMLFHSYNLEHASYDLDEAVHIWHAQKEYSAVIEQASNDPNPPVYNLILSAWVKTFGVGEFSTRFLSVIFGALGVGLMFLVASRNFGLAVGIIAALFYCFSPIQFRFTHLARPYSILMVTVLLSYGALFEALKSPKKGKLFWYYLATTVMIYIHPTSVFNLGAQGLIVIARNYRNIKSAIRLFIPMVGAVVSFGIWVVSIPYFERDDAMWFGPPSWEEVKYVLLVFYANWQLFLLQLVLLVLAVIAIIRPSVKVTKEKLGLILLWAIVPFVISIGFSHLVKPVFQDKYILSVQPAMMLLLAYCIYLLWGKLFKLTAFVSALGFLFLSLDTTPNPEGDWKHVVDYVKPIHDENSVVLIEPWYEFRTFSYYFDREAYEEPDSTIKALSVNRVHTGWNDALNLSLQRKANSIHLISAHEGAFESQVDDQVLNSLSTLVRDTQFIGIRLRTFEFLRILGYQNLTFDNQPGGRFLMNKDELFSPALTVPFSTSQIESKLQITASVDIRSAEALNGVVFIVSVERDNDQSFIYHKIDIEKSRMDHNWFTVKDQFTVSEFEPDWIVKVYVWNTEGIQFELDNLKLQVLN